MNKWISRFLFALTFVFAAEIFAPAVYARTDGTYVFKDLVLLKGAGWIIYRWTHPVTKKLQPETANVVQAGKYYFGVGVKK